MDSNVLVILGVLVVLVVAGNASASDLRAPQNSQQAAQPNGQQTDSTASQFASVVNAIANAMNAGVKVAQTSTQRN